MLFSEFIEGTGCKENEHNYKVYRNLEVMYMNTDMTKQEIYEYGKKLVDNSKTPEQIEFEEQIKSEIAKLKEEIKKQKANAEMYEQYHKEDKTDTFWKNEAKWCRDLIKRLRNEIRELQFVLG